MFNITEASLKEQKGIHTATEIAQQPEVWKELTSTLYQQKDAINDFLTAIYEKHDKVKVVFTGAGTSAFIGDILVPELRKQSSDNVQFEAIPTTNIVSNPEEYLQDEPTIMVSFARSGNSPESLASVKLGEQRITDFYQVVITCNKEGELATNIQADDKAITILTPEQAHDQGFAMTSSFTCMLMAAYSIFTPTVFTGQPTKQLIANAEQFIESIGDQIDDILAFDFDRIAYLGSGSLGQLAHEASLKMLELSAGRVVSVYESSLGFRHGPKSILNDSSMVVVFLSQDPYTRQYDMDILRELSGDDSNMKVVAVTEKADTEVEELADWVISANFGEDTFTSDFHLALIYIIFAQVLAVKKSLALGITPDNPSPSGRVNRVVQGVTIHPYEG